MDRGLIYCLHDHKGLRYVGQTIQPLALRLKQHLWYSSKNKSHLGSWLRSLNVSPTIEVIEECSYDRLDELELKWIKELQLLGCDLVNSMVGCERSGHHTHSEETKKKIGEATTKTHTGMKRSKTTVGKLQEAMCKPIFLLDVESLTISEHTSTSLMELFNVKRSTINDRLYKFKERMYRGRYHFSRSESELKRLLKQLGI